MRAKYMWTKIFVSVFLGGLISVASSHPVLELDPGTSRGAAFDPCPLLLSLGQGIGLSKSALQGRHRSAILVELYPSGRQVLALGPYVLGPRHVGLVREVVSQNKGQTFRILWGGEVRVSSGHPGNLYGAFNETSGTLHANRNRLRGFENVSIDLRSLEDVRDALKKASASDTDTKVDMETFSDENPHLDPLLNEIKRDAKSSEDVVHDINNLAMKLLALVGKFIPADEREELRLSLILTKFLAVAVANDYDVISNLPTQEKIAFWVLYKAFAAGGKPTEAMLTSLFEVLKAVSIKGLVQLIPVPQEETRELLELPLR
ncbi:MAG: hypothetical protein KDD51_08165 [Bdellovibrionales bacterium]|nr:hypothetical protein [Bdellovibrionales bacterium]